MPLIDLEARHVKAAATPFSEAQFALLTHIRNQGFLECPEPIALTAEAEYVTYVEGDDLADMRANNRNHAEELLVKVCLQWKRLTAACGSFKSSSGHRWPSTMHVDYPGSSPAHLDLNPGNVILGPDGSVSFIDFRNASLSQPLYDLALLIRHWGPFSHPDDRSEDLRELNALSRFELVCEVVGLIGDEKSEVASALLKSYDKSLEMQATPGPVQIARNRRSQRWAERI